jgi:hypothetical protein
MEYSGSTGARVMPGGDGSPGAATSHTNAAGSPTGRNGQKQSSHPFNAGLQARTSRCKIPKRCRFPRCHTPNSCNTLHRYCAKKVNRCGYH